MPEEEIPPFPPMPFTPSDIDTSETAEQISTLQGAAQSYASDAMAAANAAIAALTAGEVEFQFAEIQQIVDLPGLTSMTADEPPPIIIDPIEFSIPPFTDQKPEPPIIVWIPKTPPDFDVPDPGFYIPPHPKCSGLHFLKIHPHFHL
jgi:hypothetical protein